MPNTSLTNKIRIPIKAPNKEEIIRRIRKKSAPVIASKLRKIKQIIVVKSLNYIFEEIRKSPIIKGLYNNYAGDTTGLDLPAEFGLQPEEAVDAANYIMDKIVDEDLLNKKFEPERRVNRPKSGSVLVTIKVKGYEPKEYTKLLRAVPHTNYVSDDSGDVIPWMEWLLNPATASIDRPFGITFDRDVISSPGFISRSGRALMVPFRTKVSRDFPWKLPKAVVPIRGGDFIQDVFFSAEFRKNLGDIIRREIVKL